MTLEIFRSNPNADAIERVRACDGEVLRRKISGVLQDPQLKRATLITYRYNDFDFQTGNRHTNSRASLISMLERAAMRGTNISVITRDPFHSPHDVLGWSAFDKWRRGLERLERAGVEINLHPQLHAKVYLFELEGDRRFYAVGSSNLTAQGMGFRWAECNVTGAHSADFKAVQKQTAKVAADPKTTTLNDWRRLNRKPLSLRLFRPPL